jgi:hypothetical protein
MNSASVSKHVPLQQHLYTKEPTPLQLKEIIRESTSSLKHPSWPRASAKKIASFWQKLEVVCEVLGTPEDLFKLVRK